MAELLALSKDGTQRWCQELSILPLTLGRTGDSVWQTPWDKKISRVHASLRWHNGQLHVRRLPISLNPIFYQGAPQEEFLVPPGGRFVIGDTTFIVVGETHTVVAPEPPAPAAELTCSPEELRRYKYVDADERIEVLASLPGVIRFSPSEAELDAQVVGVLLRGVPLAEEAAIVCLRPPLAGSDKPAIEVRLVKSREGATLQFRPSQRLVLEAMERRKQSVMHVWEMGEISTQYTAHTGCNWALCTPLPGDLSASWGLYLSGKRPAAQLLGRKRDDLLKSDLKFTELVADIFASLRQQGDLQRRLGQLSTFLPRPVLTVLAGLAEKDTEELLRPRPATVTVLFCDIRGSCRIAEQGQHNLMRLWQGVCEALGVMSSSILDQDGVIGDFQGDAVLAFWGWPLDVSDQHERAFRAALTICHRLSRLPPTEQGTRITCGIGIAHGPAVVGRLGTPDQFKIGVFGPTVNLASRLESLSKRLGVSIVLDENCGRYLSAEGCRMGARTRRLARIQPQGMTQQLQVTELVPELIDGATLPEQDRLDYERALEAFQQGRWPEARDLLQRFPLDGPAKLLLEYLDQHPLGPAADWNGTIVLDTK